MTQPQDPGDEPLADICIVGSPPDSGFKLSVPATPAMLDAAQTRALRRRLLPEDGIGIGVGPDGVVHIIHSYTVQLTSGYGPLVSWDVWVKLERNALGGPTLTSLTYQQQRINERFNRTRDIQQRWENGIYWTGQMGQMLVLGKAGAAGRALPGPVTGSAPTIHSIVPPLTPPTAKTTQPPTAATPQPAATGRPPTYEFRIVNTQSGSLFPDSRPPRKGHVMSELAKGDGSRFPGTNPSFRRLREGDASVHGLSGENTKAFNIKLRRLLPQNANPLRHSHAIIRELEQGGNIVLEVSISAELSMSQVWALRFMGVDPTPRTLRGASEYERALDMLGESFHVDTRRYDWYISTAE